MDANEVPEQQNAAVTQPLSQEAKLKRKAQLELDNDECSRYLDRHRAYGEGEIRINQNRYLSEDIYNIGFICQIRNDIME